MDNRLVTIEDTEGQYRIWRNAARVPINAACFSCRWAETYNMQNDKKCKLVHSNDADTAVHKRTHCCRAWEPAPQYAYVCTGRNYKGGVATPGKVKTAGYLHWYADWYKSISGSIYDIRQEYMNKYPGSKVFWEDMG